VRMLGTGRPFYLELINPTKVNLTPEELINVQKEIQEYKNRVEVMHLCMVSR
jgi:tRNA pseudouridine synthase 10